MAPSLNFLFNANQQSGSSYPPSLLKRESVGVDRASFITSSMVWLERCRILVLFELMGGRSSKHARRPLTCRSGISLRALVERSKDLETLRN